MCDHEALHQVTSSPGWEMEPFQWDIEENHQKLDRQSEVTGYRPGLLRSPSPLLILRLSAFLFPQSNLKHSKVAHIATSRV